MSHLSKIDYINISFTSNNMTIASNSVISIYLAYISNENLE